MTFLPIVEREVRVSAMQPYLYGWRWIPVMLAILICLPPYYFNTASGKLTSAGYQCFLQLVWMMQLLALTAVLPAYHGINSERREGTLRLLFLTDLKGIDVLLGKTTAFAMEGFMVMLGLVPFMAITLLMGGVAGGELMRSAAAIFNTLVFSISVGLWAASRFTDTETAWKNVILWAGGISALPVCLSFAAFERVPLLAASPFGAFLASADIRYSKAPMEYWLSLGLVQLESWIFFYLANRAITSTWREPSNEARKVGKFRSRAPSVIGDQEPINWLAERLPWQKGILWCTALMSMVSDTVMILINGGMSRNINLQFISVMIIFLHFGFYILLAWAVCRFLVDSRRSGSFEMLAVTPLGSLKLIQLYWGALQNQLRLPVILILFGELTRQIMTPMFFLAGLNYIQHIAFIVQAVMFAVLKLISIYATCWVGMLMACKARNILIAVGKTACYLVLVPMLLQAPSISLANYLIRTSMSNGASYYSFAWLWLLTPAVNIFTFMTLLLWARRKLQGMQPGESEFHRLEIFSGLNRRWVNRKINAIRLWKAD